MRTHPRVSHLSDTRQVAGAINAALTGVQNAGIVSVADFGARGDGATDDTVAIQAAIDAATGTLTFPAGIYVHSGLTFKNATRYIGAGIDTALTQGTVLLYTGTGDGVVITNPYNSSTAADIAVENIAFRNQTLTAGKGAFADTGSTRLTFHRCSFSGADRQLILDQTELCDITECDFEAASTGATAGLWIVNGSDRAVGAFTGFSNRISVYKSNFNGVTTAIGIVDDGGNMHSFVDNNFNALLRHIRAAGVLVLKIDGGEMESASSAPILFSSVTLAGNGVGTCDTVSVNNLEIVPAGGTACIDNDALGSATFGNLFLGNTASAKITQCSNIAVLDASGLQHGGGGAVYDGNPTAYYLVGNDGLGDYSIKTNMVVKSDWNLDAGQVYRIDGTQIIGARGAAITNGVNAAAAPTQAEFNALVTQFNLVLAAMRTHGLIAP